MLLEWIQYFTRWLAWLSFRKFLWLLVDFVFFFFFFWCDINSQQLQQPQNLMLSSNNHKMDKEIVRYYCCYHLCGLISRHFHYLTKKVDLQIVILENIHKFLVFLRKMKDKKFRRSYQMNMNHYLYRNDYDSLTDTFSFNMHLFS